MTDELIRETSDAVSQRAVRIRTQLDKATVSYLMGVLATRDLVDRGPEFDGPSYRIWLTESGRDLLARASSVGGTCQRLAGDNARHPQVIALRPV